MNPKKVKGKKNLGKNIVQDLNPGSVSGVEKYPNTRIVIIISDHIPKSLFGLKILKFLINSALQIWDGKTRSGKKIQFRDKDPGIDYFQKCTKIRSF
jgi:hypothetical protein